MSNGSPTVREKLTGNKMLAGFIWGGLNMALVVLEPVFGFDKDLVKLFMTSSTYITAGLIIGFTGSQAVESWSKTKICNGKTTPTMGESQGGQP